MSWKDYFYFEKRDQTTIVLLLILIVVSGIMYILTQGSSQYISPDEEAKYLDELGISEIKSEKSTHKSHSIATYYPNKLVVGETIELNKADTTALKKIPGIGSAYAIRIVKYRNLLGGYATINQLQEVWGVDHDLYKKITPYLTVEVKPKKLKINTLEFKQLLKHPYLDYEQTKAIVDIRTRKGEIRSINRLALLEEFTEDDIKRLSAYLSFE